MVINRAILKVRDSEYDILRFNYKFQRDVDRRGRPCSVYYGGEMSVKLESTDDTTLFKQLIDEDMPTVDGSIEVLSGDDEVCVRKIEFKEAYIYSYGEQMQCTSSLPMTTTVSISPMRLDFNNNTLRLDRKWPRANGWQKYVEESTYIKPTPQAPPTPLVKTVKGETSALPNDEVEYSVTNYNINVLQSDKDRVKWMVEVDGKQELQKQQGEKVKLTIMQEWTNKKITVMPYLKKPNPEVSVKTKVEERLSLFFNGKFLILRIAEQGQIQRFSYKAVSGRPLKDGSFDYSRTRQKIKNEGPIPEGEYYINPQEIQYSKDRTTADKIYGVLGRGTMRGGERSWGVGRIWILPSSVTIDGITRNDFSIHGGYEAGSAGCIDLTDNDEEIFNKIESYRMRTTKVKLIVKYQ